MSTETSTQGEAGGASGPRDSLTVVDNRTGSAYEVPIEDGTVRATAFRQIKVSEIGRASCRERV